MLKRFTMVSFFILMTVMFFPQETVNARETATVKRPTQLYCTAYGDTLSFGASCERDGDGCDPNPCP